MHDDKQILPPSLAFKMHIDQIPKVSKMKRIYSWKPHEEGT